MIFLKGILLKQILRFKILMLLWLLQFDGAILRAIPVVSYL